MNAIEINKLEKSYKDFKLGPIDLILPKGCIMGLIGKNGAGKSTVIKLILDMVHKDRGSIAVLGKDNTQNFEVTKQDIGVVLDEVGYPANITVCQLNNIMKYAYGNWNEKLFFEYAERLSVPDGKAFKDMSKGMKMKLAFAAALSHCPKLLILDEATAGLDPVVRDEVVDILIEFTRDENHSVLISSHIVSDLEKLCDYIAFMHNGKLMFCQEKDILKEQYGIIRCSEEEAEGIEARAIIGKRVSPYGVEAMVKRDKVPKGMEISPAGIEELFIFMIKGEEK